MFTEFYKYSGRPFQLNPDPKFFFGSRNHKKAMAYLTYGLNQGEGFIVITGDIGTGKSTLVGHLLSQLDSTRFIAAKVVTTQIEADDTLRMVASAFGIPQENRDKATLLREIESFLISTQEMGRRVLLIIDEVQNLPVASLEELRMLSNFQVDERSVLQCYLLGQPQFRNTLSSERLEQLRQRVIASYHLKPLDADDTRAYIEHRMAMVGGTDNPKFTDDAYTAIFQKTRGVPRRINTLCTRMLLFGFLEERHEIDGAAVDEVFGDMAEEMTQGGPEITPALGGAPGARAAAPTPIPPSVPPDVAPEAIPDELMAEPLDETIAAPISGPPAVAAAPGSDYLGLLERIDVLEKHVKAHEDTISRALELAADYLEAAEENKSDAAAE